MTRSLRAATLAALGGAFAFLSLLACRSQPEDGAREDSRTRLVVVLVVDQFRHDYLQRYAGWLQGGLAKLMQEGARCGQAYHEHAFTEGASGHATLLTGNHPSQHGVVGNVWFDRQSRMLVDCVEDPACSTLSWGASGAPLASFPGKSPRHLLRTTLGDWLKARDPQTRVISVAGKGRSAVLMAGHRADAAYWFEPARGAFVTSSHYLTNIPAWVHTWHAGGAVERHRTTVWNKLLPESAYYGSREDIFAAEADGLHNAFPHPLMQEDSKDPQSYYARLLSSPYGDQLTLEFALECVRAEALGRDDHPDLLCIGLAATDLLGHAFGPLSQEMQDNVLRLDRSLADFLQHLEDEVGLAHCLVVLTADHGVMPLPEELRRRGMEAARVPYDEVLREIEGVCGELDASVAGALAGVCNGVYLDPARLPAAAAEQSQLRRQLAGKLRTLSWLQEVYTVEDLAAANPSQRILLRFQHAYHRERSPDLLLHRKPYYLIWGREQYGTTHGSEHDYDAHVPMIFWGKAFLPGDYVKPCATVDLAPTLAAALQLRFPPEVEGRPLHELLRSASRQVATR